MQAADARWAAKPSLLNKPRPQKVGLGIRYGQIEGATKSPDYSWGDLNKEVGEAAGSRERQKESPWNLQKEHFGQTWQPEAWSPEPFKKVTAEGRDDR